MQPCVENKVSAREALRDARALISEPARFCQGCMARNKDGELVFFDADDACRWCALGGIRKCSREEKTAEAAEQLLRGACSTLFGISLATIVNDGEDGHAKILIAFELAIERAS